MSGLDARQPRIMPTPDISGLALHDAKIAEGRLTRGRRKEFHIPFQKFAKENPVLYFGGVVFPFILSRVFGGAGDFHDIFHRLDGFDLGHTDDHSVVIANHDLVQLGAVNFLPINDLICSTDVGADLLIKSWETVNVLFPNSATPKPELVKAAQIMGVDKWKVGRIVNEEGASGLAKMAAREVYGRTGSVKDACLAVLAVAWKHMYPDARTGEWVPVVPTDKSYKQFIEGEHKNWGQVVVELKKKPWGLLKYVQNGFKSGVWAADPVIPVKNDNPPINPEPQSEPKPTQLIGNLVIGATPIPESIHQIAEALNIEDNNLTAFTLDVNGVDTNFVSIPTVIESGRSISDERLFMQIDGEWIELNKFSNKDIQVNIKGKSETRKLVEWLFNPSAGVFTPVETETVLFYPEINKKDWDSMTEQERQEFVIAFAPPSKIADNFPGFSRTGSPILIEGDKVKDILDIDVAINTTLILPADGPAQIAELQTRLGNDYQFVAAADGSYQELRFNGVAIPDLKFFADGTSSRLVQFNRQSMELVVADLAITKGQDGQLVWGVWEYQDGQWSIVTDRAPGTITDTDHNHELIAIQGHPKYEQMLATVHVANAMALEKTAVYDPTSEFEGINITLDSGKVIENIDLVPSDWIEVKQNPGGVDGVIYRAEPRHYTKGFYMQYLNARPIQVAIDGKGYFNVKVLDSTSQLLYDFLHVPVVAMNSDRTIIKMSGLISRSLLTDYIVGLMTRENRGKISPIVMKGAKTGNVQAEANLFSDENIRQFFEDYNRGYFEKYPDLDAINSLPEELNSMAFFDFLETYSIIIRQ